MLTLSEQYRRLLWAAPAHRCRSSTELCSNTYKVLLTRPMVGVLVMSPDPDTQAVLESLVRVRRVAPAG